MEFKTPDEATIALNSMQGYAFDAKHTFIINRFSDIEKYANMNPVYAAPAPEDYKARVCTAVPEKFLIQPLIIRNTFGLG